MCSRWELEAGGSIHSSVELDSQSLTPHHWVISAVQLLFLVRRHSKCYRGRPELRASGPWAGWASWKNHVWFDTWSRAGESPGMWCEELTVVSQDIQDFPSPLSRAGFTSVNAGAPPSTSTPCVSILSSLYFIVPCPPAPRHGEGQH